MAPKKRASTVEDSWSEQPGLEIAPDVSVEGKPEPQQEIEVHDVSDGVIDLDVIEDAAINATGSDAPRSSKRTRKTKPELEQENEDLRKRLAETESRKAKEFHEQSVKTLADTLSWAANVGFGVLERMRGPHFKLDDGEAESFGQAWSVVAAQYADKLNIGIPWIVALTTTYGILAPKIKADSQRKVSMRIALDPDKNPVQPVTENAS